MFIKYIEDFLTTEECDYIIDLGCSIGLEQMRSSLIVNGKLVEENVGYSGNKRMGCYFTHEFLDLPMIKNISGKILELSNTLNPFNGISYDGIPKYSFNRYAEGDFLDWHPDSHEVMNGATITYIIQLNDNYEGGSVRYSINDIEHLVEKKKGSVFIFDSNIIHAVDTIIKGTRYSINVWPSKNIKKSLI